MLGILPRAQAWRYLDMIVVEKKLFVSRCPKLRALNCLFVRSDQVSRNFRTKTEDIKEAAAAWLCLLRSTYKSTKKKLPKIFFLFLGFLTCHSLARNSNSALCVQAYVFAVKSNFQIWMEFLTGSRCELPTVWQRAKEIWINDHTRYVCIGKNLRLNMSILSKFRRTFFHSLFILVNDLVSLIFLASSTVWKWIFVVIPSFSWLRSLLLYTSKKCLTDFCKQVFRL